MYGDPYGEYGGDAQDDDGNEYTLATTRHSDTGAIYVSFADGSCGTLSGWSVLPKDKAEKFK